MTTSLASHLACAVVALVMGVALGQRQVARHRPEPGERRPEARVPAVDARPLRVEEAPRPASNEEPVDDAQIERTLSADDVRRGTRKEWWAAVEVLRRTEDRAARVELLRELLTKPDAKLVERATATIAGVGGPEGLALATALLAEHESSRVRRQAARELGEMGGIDARGPLLRAFAMDGSLRVRTVAAVELARLGDPAPREALVVHLGATLDDPDGVRRREAVERLGELRAASALVPLGRALKDPNSDVRRAAVEAIDRLDGPQARALLEQASHDANPAVAREAARALEE